MIVGDFAKYRNTGTVGKIVDIMEEGKVTWALMDTTDLYYDMDNSRSSLRGRVQRGHQTNRGRKDQLEEIDRYQKDIEDAVEKFGGISPPRGLSV
jgi:hypothetical protein